jgi:lysozyme
MNITNAVQIAMQLCKKWEGCRLQAYPDPATGGDPWTIGYGATGPDIKKGVVWTQEQADADLRIRLQDIVGGFSSFITVPLNDNQAAALASLQYNIGKGNLQHSTLVKYLNSGNYQAAAEQFLVWNRATGHVMAGLYNRRKAEHEVFFGGSV